MQILLCAATGLELEPTLAFLRERDLEERVEVLITGVGLVAATYSLTKWLADRRPGLVIQAGVAGALNEGLALGQVVVVGSETIGDEGVSENGEFRTLFHLGLSDAQQPPFKDGHLVNPGIDQPLHAGLQVVRGVSVNQISTGPEQIAYYRDQLGADIETMEGAALHYVAAMEQVPFLQLRSISNHIGERDKRQWRLKEAVETVNKELQHILIKTLEI
jgi:futalosine hydrolase